MKAFLKNCWFETAFAPQITTLLATVNGNKDDDDVANTTSN